VRIARSTVKEYLDRATAAGLSWEAAAALNEEELDRRLFAAADTRLPDRPLPDWEAVEKELRGRGVTLRLEQDLQFGAAVNAARSPYRHGSRRRSPS
jgi:transposase